MSMLSLVKVPLGKPREFFLCLLSSPQPLPPQQESSREAAACLHFPKCVSSSACWLTEGTPGCVCSETIVFTTASAAITSPSLSKSWSWSQRLLGLQVKKGLVRLELPRAVEGGSGAGEDRDVNRLRWWEQAFSAAAEVRKQFFTLYAGVRKEGRRGARN